ncbi:ACT domain-containing protein [Methylobacterium aquaticum]
MTAEADLGRLLAGMRPELRPGTDVFVTLDEAQCRRASPRR